MKKLLSTYMIGFGIFLLTSFGYSNNEWWPNIDSKKKCEQAQKDKFAAVGHISTVHIVSLIAGQDDLASEKYAFFSQAPDQLSFRFSAPSVSVWAGLLPWEYDYRHEITAILHSLHGGDKDRVMIRRDKLKLLLKKLILENKNRDNDWKIGFMLHALGDSYAHTYKDENGKEHAYGELTGHLIEKGSYSPDSTKENINNYLKYIDALYDVLKTKNASDSYLEDFKKYILDTSKGNEANMVGAINSYFLPRFITLNYCNHEKWANSIKKADVHHFLKKVQSYLENNNIDTIEI